MNQRNYAVASMSNRQFDFVDPNDFRCEAKLTWEVKKKSVQGAKGILWNAAWTLTEKSVVRIPSTDAVTPSEVGTENGTITTRVSFSTENQEEMVKRLVVHSQNLLLLANRIGKGLPPEPTIELACENTEVVTG